MSKIIDITDKLNFEESPKLKIKDKELSVNDDAPTILKVLGIVGEDENITTKAVIQLYELLFDKKSRNEIDKLKLKFKDFATLVMSAMELVTGSDDNEGEAVTPATT